jgi:hypothetical protein
MPNYLGDAPDRHEKRFGKNRQIRKVPSPAGFSGIYFNFYG